MDEDIRAFASDFQRFMQRMLEVAGSERSTPELRMLIDEHLGSDSSRYAIVSHTFEAFDHVNVQTALDAYLVEPKTSHRALGVSGQARHFGSFADLLEMGSQAGVRVGQPDYVDLPAGPSETLSCIQYGILLVSRGDERFAVQMRGVDERMGNEGVSLQVLSPDPNSSKAFLVEIRRLIVELNVFRGQVLSFGEARFGHMSIGPIVFHERPAQDRDRLVLSPGILESVELEVLGIGEHKERLLHGGQHVKRGILLHGPPGTGKTHTVRYLVSRTDGVTVLLLTGGGLHLVRQACALARMLQPAMVILEDIDLVAMERGYMGNMGNPMLFDVLNEMDGMAEDADVAFLLTTNRADILEPALAARPGRVDLAVEIGLPDDDSRRRLLDLYGRELDLRLENPDTVIARTSGVTAAFIKELVRKSALLAVDRSDGAERISVKDEHVNAALDELLAERSELTRVLLGGASEGRPAPNPQGWLTAE